jgi:hypothetical protein
LRVESTGNGLLGESNIDASHDLT